LKDFEVTGKMLCRLLLYGLAALGYAMFLVLWRGGW